MGLQLLLRSELIHNTGVDIGDTRLFHIFRLHVYVLNLSALFENQTSKSGQFETYNLTPPAPLLLMILLKNGVFELFKNNFSTLTWKIRCQN